MDAREAQQRLLQQAYLFDDPDAYSAGVEAAFETLAGIDSSVDAPAPEQTP